MAFFETHIHNDLFTFHILQIGTLKKQLPTSLHSHSDVNIILYFVPVFCLLYVIFMWTSLKVLKVSFRYDAAKPQRFVLMM